MTDDAIQSLRANAAKLRETADRVAQELFLEETAGTLTKQKAAAARHQITMARALAADLDAGADRREKEAASGS